MGRGERDRERERVSTELAAKRRINQEERYLLLTRVDKVVMHALVNTIALTSRLLYEGIRCKAGEERERGVRQEG